MVLKGEMVHSAFLLTIRFLSYQVVQSLSILEALRVGFCEIYLALPENRVLHGRDISYNHHASTQFYFIFLQCIMLLPTKNNSA